MRPKLLFILILVWPFLGLSQQNTKPEAIKDTAAFLEDLAKEMRAALMEDYQPSKTKVSDKKASYPLPVSLSENLLKESNAAFVGSFSFRPSPFNANELLVENDNFFYPEPKLVSVDIKWLKALDKGNKNLIAKDEKSNEILNFSVHYTGSQFIKLNGDVAKDIVRAEGEVTIKAPVKFATITLTKDMLFKPQKLDTFQIKLLRIENNLASIWVSGDYKHIECYPFNTLGIQLNTTSNSSMTLAGDQKELAGLKLPKDLGPGSFIYLKATGTVDRLVVLTVSKYMEQKLKCILVPVPPLENGKMKSDKERYQAFQATDFTHLIKPDTAAFKAKDNIRIIKDYSEWDKETKWRMAYTLPAQLTQTAYALPEFKDFTVLLKNKPVKTYEVEGYFDVESGTLNYVPLDDEYKPINYDEVRGNIHLRYPSTIKTVVVKKGEKKFGIEKIEGNKLTINDNLFGDTKEYINSPQLLVLRAYGKSSWPLKKDNYYVSESTNEVQLSQYFYYGNILSVQIDQPGDWIEMSIPFAIKKSVEKQPLKKKGK